jgi:uncharacterized protein (TIGR02453 family)
MLFQQAPKEWFNEHRSFYEEHIRDASKALVHDAGVYFSKNDLPFLADPRRSLFRINRDIRFSKNKDPYKTDFGAFFPYSITELDNKPINALGLYFHYSLEETFIAIGVHSPAPASLKSIRTRISEEYEEFLEIIVDPKLKEEFPLFFVGDKLKTVPRGFSIEDPSLEFLRLKGYSLLSPIEFEDSQAASLIELLAQKGRAALPLLEYFNEAIELSIEK